jgi:hypothetical protein
MAAAVDRHLQGECNKGEWRLLVGTRSEGLSKEALTWPQLLAGTCTENAWTWLGAMPVCGRGWD